TTKYGLQWLCGWQDSCQSRLCNFVQFGLAIMSKNVLQLCPKSACKKQRKALHPVQSVLQFRKD
ncbi:MAG: hypothetical protein MR817_14065, partial [Lachnospiraceae bacterium]|nr:hypothetical protein [Lachnospiraceae bacterium]